MSYLVQYSVKKVSWFIFILLERQWQISFTHWFTDQIHVTRKVRQVEVWNLKLKFRSAREWQKPLVPEPPPAASPGEHEQGARIARTLTHALRIWDAGIFSSIFCLRFPFLNYFHLEPLTHLSLPWLPISKLAPSQRWPPVVCIRLLEEPFPNTSVSWFPCSAPLTYPWRIQNKT